MMIRKLTLTLLTLALAVSGMLALTSNANAELVGWGYSNYYDGVRIKNSTIGDYPSGGGDRVKIQRFALIAQGDVDTLEGGCTSGNHAANVQTWVERNDGSFVVGGPTRWLCRSEGYDKIQEVDDVIVNCDNVWVYTKWKMFDNFGADSEGQFRYRPCTAPT